MKFKKTKKKNCLVLPPFPPPQGDVLPAPDLEEDGGNNNPHLDDDSAAGRTKIYVQGEGKRWPNDEVVYQIDGSVAECAQERRR